MYHRKHVRVISVMVLMLTPGGALPDVHGNHVHWLLVCGSFCLSDLSSLTEKLLCKVDLAAEEYHISVP